MSIISIAGTLILNGDIQTGGEVTVEPSGLLIPVPNILTDTIYSCPTQSFLCQNGKSPTIDSTTSNINIRGTINGIGQGFPANNGPGSNSSMLDNQHDISDIYGATHAGIGTVSNIPGTEGLIEEFYTINNLNLILKGIDLNYYPINEVVALNVVSGPAQIEGVDFVLTGDFISWHNLGLETYITVGDVIRVIYQADTERLFLPPKNPYGSYQAPTSIGSGSGEASGGSGIRLIARNGVVNITGTINVSGENGISTRSGGGSGGSVWIDAYNIQGGGSIYSEGGDASYFFAGGGGGGYITFNYENANIYSGTMSVIGHKGGTHGLITVEQIKPFFTDKFTGTILNTKWWEVIEEPITLDNAVQMDTSTGDLRCPRLESLFQLSGKNIQVDCDFIPSGVEPSHHTSYFQMFIDDRNWVQIARKHNNIFGMYSVDGFLSQTAQPYSFIDTTFRIIKSDSTFTLQYVNATSPQTLVSDVIPEFQTQNFQIAFGTIKDEPDSSNYITDYYKLTNIDEANGYVTLSSVPVDASNVTLNVIGGSPQIYGYDYTVSGQNLYWISPNLNLAEDDEITAQYAEDGTYNNLEIAWGNFELYRGIIRGIETTRPVIYVDPVYGSDSSDGGPITPLQNLFVATAWAKRGGKVILYSGNYNPTEVENKNLTIMAAYGSTVVISSADVQDTTGSNWENSGLTFRGCQGKVSNIQFTGSREGIYADDVQNVEISNCLIHDVTTAIKFINYSKDCRVLRNTIKDASVGLDFGFQNYNPQINANVIYDTSTAVNLFDASNFVMSSNTLDNNDLCVCVDGSCKGVIASNNITNSNVGVNVTLDSTVDFYNNNFYGTPSSITGLGTTTLYNNINSDPGYANQYLGNYHLLFFSTDRSTGTSQYDQYMIDRDGVDRTGDHSYDIGAYRYVNVSHPGGTAYYVDGSGNDYLNNGSLGYPYRTLDKAMSVADSSVIISKGPYDTYYLELKGQNIRIDSTSVIVNEILKITLHGQYSDVNLGKAIYVSTGGSDGTIMGGDGTDSGGNGTLEKPYRTISRALSQSAVGDYLVIMPGDYPLFNGLNGRVIVPFNDYTSVPDERMYIEDLFNTPYTTYPNHNMFSELWNLDTTANSEINIMEGYLNMSYDGTHPVRATSLFDFSPIGTDTTAFEVSAELRQAFDPVFFSVYNGPNIATFMVNGGDYTSSLFTNGVTYSCWGHLEDTSDATDQYFTEYVCISSSEVQNKFLTLTYLIEESSEVAINVIGGTSQELGTDFYVENNKIKWDGMALDGQVKAGDVLRVQYIPHGLSDPVRVRFILENNTMTVQGMVNGHYERLMKRAVLSPVTGPWNASFYMDTTAVDHTNESSGMGYASKFLAVAESIDNTELAKPYMYKIWRQPVIIHNS